MTVLYCVSTKKNDDGAAAVLSVHRFTWCILHMRCMCAMCILRMQWSNLMQAMKMKFSEYLASTFWNNMNMNNANLHRTIRISSRLAVYVAFRLSVNTHEGKVIREGRLTKIHINIYKSAADYRREFGLVAPGHGRLETQYLENFLDFLGVFSRLSPSFSIWKNP